MSCEGGSSLHDSDVRKCKAMGKRDVEFELTKKEIEYLEESKREFDLPSVGKAMRCLINFLAQENPKIVTQDSRDDEVSKVSFKLATSQIEWLESLDADAKKRNEMFRRCLDVARECKEQDSIFAKIRCKSKTQAMVRILCIRPGFGGGRTGTRYKILESIQHFKVKMLDDMPEPIPSEMERGLNMLRAEIKSFRPHILLVGSRGGIFAKQVVEDVDAMFLMGALETRTLCSARSGNLPLLMVHGTKDDRNSIDRVRCDCRTSKIAELVELDDGHDLTSLSKDHFDSLLTRLHKRVTDEKVRSLWLEKERPKWIEKELEPKIHEFEKRARDQREEMLRRRRRQGGGMSLLSALKKGKKKKKKLDE